jgi:hypothetical protein
VAIDVSKVNFFLAEAQYRALMATLNGNLSEKSEPIAAADDDDDADVDAKKHDDAAVLAAQIAAKAKRDESDEVLMIGVFVDAIDVVFFVFVVERGRRRRG